MLPKVSQEEVWAELAIRYFFALRCSTYDDRDTYPKRYGGENRATASAKYFAEAVAYLCRASGTKLL
nr:hypothetical protein [uncultured Porphyromonas sp.]